MIRKVFLALFLCGSLFAADLKFVWDNNTEAISHYILYYGPERGVYNRSVKTLNAWKIIRRFRVGYYYACVVAVDSDGKKSPPSEEIEFKVGRKTVSVIPKL